MNRILEALMNLAEALGVQRAYFDNDGTLHHVDLWTVLLILREKGISVPHELIDRGLGVSVVSIDELPSHFLVPLEADTAHGDEPTAVEKVSLTLTDEQGGEHHFTVGSDELSVHVEQGKGPDGISVPFPRGLTAGVYDLTSWTRSDLGDHRFSAKWIVCPPTAYLPRELEQDGRIAGVGVALYGIRSQRNWGVGDFSDLKEFIGWAADELRVDFVGLNPLHATFNRSPYNTSPYMPSSRLYRNFIYLDVTAIADFRDSSRAKLILDRPETIRLVEKLRTRELVDYEGVAALKLEILQEVFRSFMELHGPPNKQDQRWSELLDYVHSEGEYLENFAVFCTLEANFRTSNQPIYSWKEWPAEFRRPTGEDVRRFRAEHESEVLFWKYVQWQIDIQLKGVQEYAFAKGMLVGLFHDEALAVDRNGADAWAFQAFFHDGFKVGTPPDEFAPDGQDWGFPPPNRERLRSAGYAPLLRRLQASCRHGGALRIDHAMQLNRLFWIPEGHKPSEGAYVEDYEADLLKLLALESQRAGTILIGEDLGTVPPEFRDRLMAKKILSYRLFYFERHHDGALVPCSAYPQNALVSITTHDLPTLAGFWSGQDIDIRSNIGQLDTVREARFRTDRIAHKKKIVERLAEDGFLSGEGADQALKSQLPTDDLHSAVLKFLFETPSRLVLINQEDIFLDTRQQNIPGTTSENPNWVTKMHYSIEDLRNHPDAVKFTDRFRGLLERAGRSAR